MFASCDFTAFGLKLKNIREAMGYVQSDVQAICGINPDTLRRIESGKTIPKYETLERLSEVYKYDLLNLLQNYRTSKKLYQYYERLNYLITNYDINTLRNLEEDFKSFMNGEKDILVNPHLYGQFELMLKGISKYNTKDEKEELKSLEIFVDALKYTIPDFTIESYKNFNYTIFEKRILLLIALSLSSHKDYERSNHYLTFILESISENYKEDMQNLLLNIKAFINLSYNSHRLSTDLKTLEFADRGIDYCVEHNVMSGLHLLYYRKGIAEFMLRKDNYMDSLRKSIHLLEIQNKLDMVKLYKDVTEKNYGFIIE